MKRAWIVSLVLFLLLGQPVWADEASKRKLAEELLTVQRTDQMIQDSFDLMKQMQMPQLKSMNVPEEKTADYQSMLNEIAKMMEKQMSWENIKSDYIGMYAEAFSEQDLKGLVKFYKSPLGQKFLDKTPELTTKVMQISQKHMAGLMPKIMELTEEMIKKK